MKILAAFMLVPALSIQESPPPPPPMAPIIVSPAEYDALLRMMETMQQINAQANDRADEAEKKYHECPAWKWT